MNRAGHDRALTKLSVFAEAPWLAFLSISAACRTGGDRFAFLLARMLKAPVMKLERIKLAPLLVR
jgi:hypothetical protein